MVSLPSSLWTMWFGNARQNWQFNKHFVCWPFLDGHNRDLASEGLRARSASFPTPTFASFILCGRNLGEDFPQGGAFATEMATNAQVSRAAITIVFVAYPLSLLSCASKFNYRSGQSVHIALPLLENILSQDYWESSLGARNRFAPRACQTRAQVRTHTRPLYQHPPRVINGFTLGWLLRLTSNKVDNMLGFERALPWLLEHNS